jgi:hypothetical protein
MSLSRVKTHPTTGTSKIPVVCDFSGCLRRMAARDKKTKAEIQEENATIRYIARWSQIGKMGAAGIRYGGLATIAYCVFRSVDSIAGKETDASIIVSIISSVKLNNALKWTVVVGSILYGLFQKRQKGQYIEQHKQHKVELEKRVDAKRSSSNLKNRAETNRGDK